MSARPLAMGVVTVSARLEPGVITQRVTHVGRASRTAKALVRASAVVRRRLPRSVGKPYRIVAISMYRDALDQLDALVTRAKRVGVGNASRSAIIRLALARLDLEMVLADAVPVGDGGAAPWGAR